MQGRLTGAHGVCGDLQISQILKHDALTPPVLIRRQYFGNRDFSLKFQILNFDVITLTKGKRTKEVVAVSASSRLLTQMSCSPSPILDAKDVGCVCTKELP